MDLVLAVQGQIWVYLVLEWLDHVQMAHEVALIDIQDPLDQVLKNLLDLASMDL